MSYYKCWSEIPTCVLSSAPLAPRLSRPSLPSSALRAHMTASRFILSSHASDNKSRATQGITRDLSDNYAWGSNFQNQWTFPERSFLQLIHAAFCVSRKMNNNIMTFFSPLISKFEYNHHSWETSSRITHCVTFGARLRISNPRNRVAYSLADSAPSLSAFSSRFLLIVTSTSLYKSFLWNKFPDGNW